MQSHPRGRGERVRRNRIEPVDWGIYREMFTYAGIVFGVCVAARSRFLTLGASLLAVHWLAISVVIFNMGKVAPTVSLLLNVGVGGVFWALWNNSTLRGRTFFRDLFFLYATLFALNASYYFGQVLFETPMAKDLHVISQVHSVVIGAGVSYVGFNAVMKILFDRFPDVRRRILKVIDGFANRKNRRTGQPRERGPN